jgi:hypothetical protein
VRGLTVDEYEMLRDLAADTCGGRPGEADDWGSFTPAEERTAARLVARELLRDYRCTCGWSHCGVTALGRTALSIHAQLVALYGPGKAA